MKLCAGHQPFFVTLRRSAEGRASKGDGGRILQRRGRASFEARKGAHLRMTGQLLSLSR
jgi:hypothetical protein